MAKSSVVLSILSLIAALLAVPSQAADLHCLKVAWWNPWLGAICHFKPKFYSKAETQVVEGVDKGVEDVKNLVKFDLEYNPVSVVYRAANATAHGGIRQGAEVLGDTGRAYKDLTVGFEKGIVNQGVQIYDILAWQDVSWCLMKGAGKLVTQKRRRMRRRNDTSTAETTEMMRPSDDDAKAMAARCLSDKFKKITKPAYFNVTEPKQQIGSTISEIATLFIPVEPEAGLVGGLVKGNVDLAVAGSEDIRILKQLNEDGIAGHFANEEEAQLVKEHVRDEKWADENCGACTLPGGGSVTGLPNIAGVATSKFKGRARRALERRGATLSACCKVPQVTESSGEFTEVLSQDDDPFAAHLSLPLEDVDGLTEGTTTLNDADENQRTFFVGFRNANRVRDAASYAKLTEADIKASPQYTKWVLGDSTSVTNIQHDLDQLNTAVIAWSPEMTSHFSSEDLFSLLRKTFQGPEDDPIYEGLDIYHRNGLQRLASVSNDWIGGTSSEMEPLRNFAKAAVDHGKAVVGKLKGLTPEQAAARLKGEVEFFWCAAGDKALKGGIDPRGLHVDTGLMQFGAQDTPGLVVQETITSTISRPPVAKDSFQLLKARSWNVKADIEGGRDGATSHGVFGAEMAERGRASMVMSINWVAGEGS